MIFGKNTIFKYRNFVKSAILKIDLFKKNVKLKMSFFIKCEYLEIGGFELLNFWMHWDALLDFAPAWEMGTYC